MFKYTFIYFIYIVFKIKTILFITKIIIIKEKTYNTKKWKQSDKETLIFIISIYIWYIIIYICDIFVYINVDWIIKNMTPKNYLVAISGNIKIKTV